MTADLPFDPQPRPGEVEQVLRRVHRRRAARAGGSGAAVLTVLAFTALTFGGDGRQVLLQDDVPIGPATGASPTPGPSTLPQSLEAQEANPGPAAPAAAAPAPAATALPPLLAPRRSPAPRPRNQASPTPTPAPEKERPAYSGQLGPSYAQYAATDCVVVNRSTGDGVVRNDYCIHFIGAGSKDSWRPRIKICRLYDSTTPGRITFPGGEEADFALYRGTQGPNGPVAGQLLFRFSDTVRYTEGAHGRDVAQGDCWGWQLVLPIDFEAYPADAGFVGEWRTRAEQFPAPERQQRVHFTAGSFHGDEYP